MSRRIKVSGKVLSETNRTIKTLYVSVYVKSFSGETLLGGKSAVTDVFGKYCLEADYTGTDDLNVIVRLKDGSTEIANSGLILAISDDIEYDFTLDADKSDAYSQIKYSALNTHILTKLGVSNYSTINTKENVKLAYQKTGVDEKEIERIVNSNTLATTYSAKGITADQFYSILELGGDLISILISDYDVIKKKLEADSQSKKIANITDIDKQVGKMKSIYVDYLLATTPGVEPGQTVAIKNITNIIKSRSGYLDSDVIKFLTEYVRNISKNDEMWGRVETSLDGNKKRNFKMLMFIAEMVERDVTKTDTIYNLFKSTTGYELNKLVEIYQKSLTALGLESEEEKTALVKIVEQNFPVDLFIYKIKNETITDLPTTLVSFIKTNADFNPSTTTIKSYALGKGLSEESVNDLEKFQRMFKMSPQNNKFESVLFMWRNNLHSATIINRITRTKFIEKYKAEFSEYRLDEIYRNAARINTLAIAVLSKFMNSMNNSDVYILENGEEASSKDTNPELTAIFNNANYILYDESRTVLSPAAYLVDLLNFLENGEITNTNTYCPNASGKSDSGHVIVTSALGAFFARRKDIAHLLLNYKNSFEKIPYIDIVNEVLENAVAGSANYYNTTLESDDIQTHPQYVNYSAYEILKNVKDSNNMNLLDVESKEYLKYIGINRAELIEFFSTSKDKSIQKTLVRLNLSLNDYSLIGNSSIQLPHSGSTPLNKSSFTMDDIKNYYNLTYEDILLLIQSNYVNPSKKEISYPEDLDISKATIAFTTNELQKAERFKVLMDRSGIDFYDLDRAIKVIATSVSNENERFNDSFLIELANFVKISEEKEVSLDNLLIISAELDKSVSYKDRTSQFEEVFSFFKKEGTDDLTYPLDVIDVVTNVLITDNYQVLSNCSGISMVELSEAIDFVKTKLSISNYINIKLVSGLKALNTLSGIVKKSVSDIVKLSNFFNIVPILSGSINIVDFIEICDLMENFDTDTARLNKIFTNKGEFETDENIEIFFEEMIKNVVTTNSTLSQVCFVNDVYRDTLSSTFNIDTEIVDYIFNNAKVGSVLFKNILTKNDNMSKTEKISIYKYFERYRELMSFHEMKLSDILIIDGNTALNILSPVKDLNTLAWNSTVAIKFKNLMICSAYGRGIVTNNSIFAIMKNDKAVPPADVFYYWNTNDFNFLVSNLGLDFKTSKVISSIKIVAKAKKITEMLKINTAKLISWKIFDPSPASTVHQNIVNSIKDSVKAYLGGNWKNDGRIIRDIIRKKQRNCLEYYLLRNDNRFSKVSDIYYYYLIDPETSTEVLTSRIKLAISTIQLFIQRSMLSMEKEITFGEDARNEWTWRKNYRV
ncbi:MAG: hypothetical protein JXR48_02685 [Candidatus Delongbacteria bacterium]|nr:hypothetical protein [Candidatus Delongbacteria bacterium]MBN2833853.1 hypothetical protein [Candidatus Delongbacteria bacterium]